MESYCVIQFKNKQEKGKILTFLAVETEAEFKVTADLKKFVAEKFSVTIVENVLVNPNEIEQAKKDQNVAVIPPTNNIATEQAPSPVVANQEKEVKKEVVLDITDGIVTSDCLIIDQPLPVSSVKHVSMKQNVDVDPTIPDIDNTQNLMNMDDYGTYVPYLERPIEPKEEIIDDAVVVMDTGNSQEHEILEDVNVEKEKEVIIGDGNNDGLIGNDGADDISVDDVLMPNQVDTPSSSMKRRSCRSAIKPRYSMDDDSDEEYTPPTKCSKKTNQTLEKVAGGKKKKTECKKCGSELINEYSKKIIHAIIHTDIMSYKCLLNGCAMKFKTRSNMVSHLRFKHKSQLNAFTNIELTSEQNAEIYSMMKECFDGSDGNSDDNCQICHQNVGGNSSNSSSMKKEHALHHVNFMRYTCTEKGCPFESKTKKSMKAHLRYAHPEIANPKLTKIKLTAEQELEVGDIVVKCFPNLDKYGSAT